MSKIGYLPRLDGLRALAVSAVLLDHFVHADVVHSWRPGAAGVRLFFVLSGFLITSILLLERGRPVILSARTFFWRRIARLSPPLYLAIAAAAALGIAGMRQDWWKHALYLTNFQVAHAHSWGGAAHFWTLSVEEQFYLLWFFAVVAAPRRALLPLILGCLAAGPIYRALLPHDGVDFTAILLPGQLDSLGLGALLAYARRAPALQGVDRFFASKPALLASLAAAVALSLPLHWPYIVAWVAMPFAVSLAAACAVRCAAEPFSPGRGGLLALPPVRRLGRISYGLYVYHYFVPEALGLAIPGFATPHGPVQKLATAAVAVTVSAVLAEASWRWLEQPALRLKHLVGDPSTTAAYPAAAAEPPAV